MRSLRYYRRYLNLNAAKLIIFLWWKYEQTRGRILLQDRGQGNKSIRIGERDRRARSKFLRGRGDPGRCRRSIRFLPYTLFLLRTFSPSNKGEAVINTCVYSSTTFPPSSPPVSARHLCLEAPRPLNFSPCVRMTLPVIIFRTAVLYRRIRLTRLRISFMRCVLVPEKFSPSFLLERTRKKSNLRVMKSLIDCVLRRLQSPLVNESLSAT